MLRTERVPDSWYYIFYRERERINRLPVLNYTRYYINLFRGRKTLCSM